MGASRQAFFGALLFLDALLPLMHVLGTSNLSKRIKGVNSG